MKLLYENRSEEDKAFIKEVCNSIISQPITEKENNDEFCGIYIEGRDREINCLEDWSSLYSFKRFSKFNYPIFVFCNTNKNFMNGDYATLDRVTFIQISQLNSLDEYSNFIVKDLYHLIPKQHKYAVHLQPDAMLLKSGWEDIVLKKNWIYIGSPWGHAPAIEYKDKDGIWKDFFGPVRIGNGGFSIRHIDFCRAVSLHCGNFDLREKYTQFKIPPEDLFYSVIATYLNGNVPTIEEANQFCCDPLNRDAFNQKGVFGFHYFSEK